MGSETFKPTHIHSASPITSPRSFSHVDRWGHLIPAHSINCSALLEPTPHSKQDADTRRFISDGCGPRCPFPIRLASRPDRWTISVAQTGQCHLVNASNPIFLVSSGSMTCPHLAACSCSSAENRSRRQCRQFSAQIGGEACLFPR
jgi:hypothetical protein